MKFGPQLKTFEHPAIDQAINVLKDVDPDQLNYYGVAIEETMQNEGIEVVEDTEFLMDNPVDQKRWLTQITPEKLSIFDINITTNNAASYHSKLKSII